MIRPSYDGKFQIADLELTLSFPIQIAAKNGIMVASDKDALEKSIGADTWYDGRVEFSREMLEHALAAILKTAVYQTVLQFFASKFGNEMVENEIGDKMLRSYVETDKWMKESFLWASIGVDGGLNAAISEPKGQNDD